MTLPEAMARIEADPIALEIMWSRLVTVVEEMWLTVCRNRLLAGDLRGQDFACELLDPDGETLAHSPRAMPVFNLTLPRAVKALLAEYPAETLQPGDVLITNDPWLVRRPPVRYRRGHAGVRGGRLVGLMGTVGHVSTSRTKGQPASPRDLREGFQIPPMKLVEAGRPNQTLFRLLAENVRNPGQVTGDVHSFVAANALGCRAAGRLHAGIRHAGPARPGRRGAGPVGEGECARRSRRCRTASTGRRSRTTRWGKAALSPGADHRGDSITLDFAGAPAQLPQGGLNCTLNYTEAHATIR